VVRPFGAALSISPIAPAQRPHTVAVEAPTNSFRVVVDGVVPISHAIGVCKSCIFQEISIVICTKLIFKKTKAFPMQSDVANNNFFSLLLLA
jgi:hypothetical protein